MRGKRRYDHLAVQRFGGRRWQARVGLPGVGRVAFAGVAVDAVESVEGRQLEGVELEGKVLGLGEERVCVVFGRVERERRWVRHHR